MARDKVSTDILWKDRKRILFLGLPWSFTRYSVSKDRFFISKGFFSVKDDEVRLYRIMDISLERVCLPASISCSVEYLAVGGTALPRLELSAHLLISMPLARATASTSLRNPSLIAFICSLSV